MDVEHMIENDKSNDLLIQRKIHISSGKEEITIDSCYHCHIELLRILKRKRVPLCLFDEIMNWANQSVKYKGYQFENPPFTRNSIINTLFTRYDLHGLKPQKRTIQLPSSNREVEVVIHDVRQAIYSILCDPFLNQDHKYYFKDFETPILPINRNNSINMIFSMERHFRMPNRHT